MHERPALLDNPCMPHCTVQVICYRFEPEARIRIHIDIGLIRHQDKMRLTAGFD